MIKITKEGLKEKLVYFKQELGLTNDKVAERLNTEYNAEDKEKLTAMDVSKLLKQLGLQGLKPKKQALFEFVSEEKPVVTEQPIQQ